MALDTGASMTVCVLLVVGPALTRSLVVFALLLLLQFVRPALRCLDVGLPAAVFAYGR